MHRDLSWLKFCITPRKKERVLVFFLSFSVQHHVFVCKSSEKLTKGYTAENITGNRTFGIQIIVCAVWCPFYYGLFATMVLLKKGLIHFFPPMFAIEMTFLIGDFVPVTALNYYLWLYTTFSMGPFECQHHFYPNFSSFSFNLMLVFLLVSYFNVFLLI